MVSAMEKCFKQVYAYTLEHLISPLVFIEVHFVLSFVSSYFM